MFTIRPARALSMGRVTASPQGLDPSDRLGGGLGVAAVAERHVGPLGRQADDDRPADPAGAAGDHGALVAEIDHRACSFQSTRRGRSPAQSITRPLTYSAAR